MVMDNFSGLISQVKTQNKINMFNIMMESGGVVYPMDKALIKELMVIFVVILGDLYTGHFKNGLKHG